MADVCTFLPATGSLVNLNDRTNTFVGYGIDMGAKATIFDEVRSYTGAIRQVDVHQPLIDVVIPMKVVATDSDTLYDKVAEIKAAVVQGGTLTWQPDGQPSRSYTIGCSPEPEIKEDEVHKLHHMARFELHLKRLP